MVDIIVNSLLDDGDGDNTTLREAVTQANQNGIGPDRIIFDPEVFDPTEGLHLIRLNGTEIEITGGTGDRWRECGAHYRGQGWK